MALEECDPDLFPKQAAQPASEPTPAPVVQPAPKPEPVMEQDALVDKINRQFVSDAPIPPLGSTSGSMNSPAPKTATGK